MVGMRECICQSGYEKECQGPHSGPAANALRSEQRMKRLWMQQLDLSEHVVYNILVWWRRSPARLSIHQSPVAELNASLRRVSDEQLGGGFPGPECP